MAAWVIWYTIYEEHLITQKMKYYLLFSYIFIYFNWTILFVNKWMDNVMEIRQILCIVKALRMHYYEWICSYSIEISSMKRSRAVTQPYRASATECCRVSSNGTQAKTEKLNTQSVLHIILSWLYLNWVPKGFLKTFLKPNDWQMTVSGEIALSIMTVCERVQVKASKNTLAPPMVSITN